MNPPTQNSSPKKITFRHRLAMILTQEILEKNQAGDFSIESEHQLCRRFQISRVTVRLALHDLEHRGLVYRRRGKGTFAYGNSTRIHRDLGLWHPSPNALASAPVLEAIRGMQGVLTPLRACLILITTSPQEWPSDFASSLGGIVAVQREVSPPELAVLKNRKLPHLCLPSELPGKERDSFFHWGQNAAIQLNHAVTTGERLGGPPLECERNLIDNRSG